MTRRDLERARHAVAQAGPYRVISCSNDTYRVERVRVHCDQHEKPPKEYCEDCAMAGQGLGSRLQLAGDIEALLNARARRARRAR